MVDVVVLDEMSVDGRRLQYSLASFFSLAELGEPWSERVFTTVQI
jgi:hypothetical protein